MVAWTWGRDSEPIRNVRARDDDDRPRLVRRAPQLEAIVSLEPLTSLPAVAVEAWLRIGLVHFTANDFAAALRAFEAAQPIATDAAMKYLAYFNAGRALEKLQRIDPRAPRWRAPPPRRGARPRPRCQAGGAATRRVFQQPLR